MRLRIDTSSNLHALVCEARASVSRVYSRGAATQTMRGHECTFQPSLNRYITFWSSLASRKSKQFMHALNDGISRRTDAPRFRRGGGPSRDVWLAV